MATTTRDLLGHVEEGFRAGGWNLLYLSTAGEHPARYRVYRDNRAFTVRVYIWNITQGGGAARSATDYRIQNTGPGVDRFTPEIGGRTLILGWWANEEIFAGFDYRRHSGPLGGSPSPQVGVAALQGAVLNGFAIHAKTSGELAIAFRPDFIGTYADNLEPLHDAGQVPAEVNVLTRIAAQEDVPAADIEREVANPRRRALTQTMRALHALDFRQRVLDAYTHHCAVCSMQLRLVEAAHILPVAEPDSTNETSNGISLCALHHRAYDRAMLTFDPDYKVHVNEKYVDELRRAGLHSKLPNFRRELRWSFGCRHIERIGRIQSSSKEPTSYEDGSSSIKSASPILSAQLWR